jgi:hypothetical protein
VVQLLMSRARVEGFERWQDQTAEEKQMKAKTLKAVQRLINRALVKGFERWRDSFVEERQMKAKALKVVQRRMSRALVEGFEHWRAKASEDRQMKAKSVKVFQRWMSRALVEGFGRLRDQAQGARRLKGKARSVGQRLMNRALVEGFERWRDQVAGEQQMKAKERRLQIAGERILRRRRHLTQGSALLRWARCARESKRLARLAEHVVLRKRLVYCRTLIVFISWTFLACERHLQSHAVLKTVAARLTRITINILHAWRGWLGEKKHRQALWGVMSNKRGTKLTKNTMNQWQSLMAQERMLRNKAILLVSHSLQREQAEALLHHPSRFTPSPHPASRPPSVCSSAHETQVCNICVPRVF